MLHDAGFEEVIAEDRTDQVRVDPVYLYVVNMNHVEIPPLREFTFASVHTRAAAGIECC